jgi:hypothetical protein
MILSSSIYVWKQGRPGKPVVVTKIRNFEYYL